MISLISHAFKCIDYIRVVFSSVRTAKFYPHVFFHRHCLRLHLHQSPHPHEHILTVANAQTLNIHLLRPRCQQHHIRTIQAF